MYVIVVSVPILGGLLDVSNFFRLECDFLELPLIRNRNIDIFFLGVHTKKRQEHDR